MDTIKIDAAERSPEIDFDFANNTYSLRGESYPENVSVFYSPILKSLETHLTSQRNTNITFDFELIYFNSSSSKVLMDLFDLLDIAAERNNVIINWYFKSEDDIIEEMGESFGEDLENATFHMKPI